MNPDKQLTKLSPRSSWRIEQGGTTGAVITPQDVAAALGMGNLSECAEIVGRAKYLDDLTAGDRDKVINQVMLDIAPTIIKENWRVNTPGMIKKLIMFALYEIICPPGCTECAGRGHKTVDNVVQDCQECLGTGLGSFTEYRIAKSCEIDQSLWSRIWGKRYRVIYETLRGYDAEIIKHVRRYIG